MQDVQRTNRVWTVPNLLSMARLAGVPLFLWLVLGPEADVLTSELYGVVDAALARLDPIDAGLITLVDIEGAPFEQVLLELDLPSRYARDHLATARLAVLGALDRHIRS